MESGQHVVFLFSWLMGIFQMPLRVEKRWFAFLGAWKHESGEPQKKNLKEVENIVASSICILRKGWNFACISKYNHKQTMNENCIVFCLGICCWTSHCLEMQNLSLFIFPKSIRLRRFWWFRTNAAMQEEEEENEDEEEDEDGWGGSDIYLMQQRITRWAQN